MAIRQGWGGRPVDRKAATGMLIAALGLLAAHLGYGGVKRASGRCLCVLDDGFRIEEQKSAVATASAVRDPKLTFPHSH